MSASEIPSMSEYEPAEQAFCDRITSFHEVLAQAGVQPDTTRLAQTGIPFSSDLNPRRKLHSDLFVSGDGISVSGRITLSHTKEGEHGVIEKPAHAPYWHLNASKLTAKSIIRLIDVTSPYRFTSDVQLEVAQLKDPNDQDIVRYLASLNGYAEQTLTETFYQTSRYATDKIGPYEASSIIVRASEDQGLVSHSVFVVIPDTDRHVNTARSLSVEAVVDPLGDVTVQCLAGDLRKPLEITPVHRAQLLYELIAMIDVLQDEKLGISQETTGLLDDEFFTALESFANSKQQPEE